jgi:hypothetical protein
MTPWVVTPQEPDEAMLAAGIAKWNQHPDATLISRIWRVYEAMLKARPRITEPKCPEWKL